MAVYKEQQKLHRRYAYQVLHVSFCNCCLMFIVTDGVLWAWNTQRVLSWVSWGPIYHGVGLGHRHTVLDGSCGVCKNWGLCAVRPVLASAVIDKARIIEDISHRVMLIAQWSWKWGNIGTFGFCQILGWTGPKWLGAWSWFVLEWACVSPAITLRVLSPIISLDFSHFSALSSHHSCCQEIMQHRSWWRDVVLTLCYSTCHFGFPSGVPMFSNILLIVLDICTVLCGLWTLRMFSWDLTFDLMCRYRNVFEHVVMLCVWCRYCLTLVFIFLSNRRSLTSMYRKYD